MHVEARLEGVSVGLHVTTDNGDVLVICPRCKWQSTAFAYPLVVQLLVGWMLWPFLSARLGLRRVRLAA